MRAWRPARFAATSGPATGAALARLMSAPAATPAAPSARAAGFRPRPHRAGRPVHHRVGDLVAAMGRQAMQHDGIRVGQRQKSRVELKRPKRLHSVQPVVFLAHRRPGVGDQNVGAGGGRVGVGGHSHRGAGILGAALGRGPHRRVGQEALGSRDGDVDTRGDPAEQQRVGHVVGAVAEVGQPQAAQRPLAFGDGLQVGQHLTRMELIGERVDHGHRRDRRHGVQPLLAEGSPDDGIDVAGQHLCGVLQGFVAAQLGAAAVDDDGMPAQLRDAQLEGEPGAGGVLVEDDRHPARPLQGRRLTGSFFSSAASSSTSACSAGTDRRRAGNA